VSGGLLIVCATPIGNLSDVPPRLIEALQRADVVYAEDTRRTAKLLAAFGIEARLRSYFVGNEQERAPELESHLTSGRTVALVTDAGTPLVSDPGAGAVAAAVAAGATVTVIPGPSAVTAALAVSGFDADRFVFEGFLSRKGKARAAQLASLASETRTSVLFLSPHRAGVDLEDLSAALGPGRRIVVARELTKLHEEVWRGTVAEAAERFGREARGEFTVVIEGAEPAEPDVAAAVAAAQEAIAAGERPSAAVRRLAREFGVPRGELYDRVIGET
jgi:16S rRNA (cytidine1402-2'-O)-methyltransferase